MTAPRRTALIAAVLGALSFISVFVAQKNAGVARDEVDYMVAGTRYANFWVDFWEFKNGVTEVENITRHFGGTAATANNREHPPLLKTMFGFSERWFHQKLGWMSSLSAYRLPTCVLNAVLVMLVFLFTRSLWGEPEAVISALLTLFLPRAFFHAGLATFDAAVVTMWVATIFAYYKALDSRSWCVVLGVVFGLALATKHNAILLPVPLLAHYITIAVLTARRERQPGQRIGTTIIAAFSRLRGQQPWIVVALALIGPCVLIALWPWMWFKTSEHLSAWITFHLHHVHYNFEYLGKNWNTPPFPVHVPIVTTLFTVPVVTLLAGLIGGVWLVVVARRSHLSALSLKSPGFLLFVSAGAAMGPFVLRTTPIFGAEKHFAAAFPTFSIFAGVGVCVSGRLFADRLRRHLSSMSWLARHAQWLTIASLGTLAVGAAAVETIDAQPYALSHYNALAGGAPGGADYGMNRQFWGVAARGILPLIREHAEAIAPKILTVYAHDADKTFGVYRRLGLVPDNVRVAKREMAGIRSSDLAIVIHELHFNRHDYLIWKAYGSVAPIAVLRTDGVPIVSVYARQRSVLPGAPSPSE